METDILHCLEVLHRGGIILYPTDTIWGLGCDATNYDAVKKIYKLKRREESKSMIILVADERDIMQYVAAPDPEVFIYLEKTEKPTTVIYDNVIGLADNVVAADGSAGIRICQEIFCKHLLKRFRKPIVSTSANIAGMQPPFSFDDINDEIKNGVDYVVMHRQDEVTMQQPSSVIRWSNGKLEVLRP